MTGTDNDLKQRIAALELENARLCERIDFLEYRPALMAGLRGERVVSRSIDGQLTAWTASHDVISPGGVLLEVKFASLSPPVKGSPARRWAWKNVLGQRRQKVYDRLILMGEADDRYRDAYIDPSSPYVIFDVPRAEVTPLIGVRGEISVSTNPSRKRSAEKKTAILFARFAIAASDLSRRYGITEIPKVAQAETPEQENAASNAFRTD